MKQLSVGRKFGTALWLLSTRPHEMAKTKLKLHLSRHCSHCGATKLTSPKIDHLERTSNNFGQETMGGNWRTSSESPLGEYANSAQKGLPARNVAWRQLGYSLRHCHEMLSEATVLAIRDASPNVKWLALHVHKSQFSFKAGQWVDLFIPGVSKVGGFSLCSSPEHLAENSQVELAVKYSPHPPAHWIHRQCSVGAEVTIRVGGNFYYDPQPSDPTHDLLLIAGGVGINPLYSILLHVTEMLRRDGNSYSPRKVSLIYTAKDSSEILFQGSLLALMKEFPEQVRCQFCVTRQQVPIPDYLQPHIKVGKLTKNELSVFVNGTPRCYICGPPPMIEFVSETLQSLGLPQARIFYEKWW